MMAPDIVTKRQAHAAQGVTDDLMWDSNLSPPARDHRVNAEYQVLQCRRPDVVSEDCWKSSSLPLRQ